MKGNIESIKAKLKNISKKEGKAYQLILIRYFQERLLYRLSQSIYREKFFLKGGALLYAFEKEKSRPTLDIDLSAQKIKNDQKLLGQVFKDVVNVNYLEDGVVFDNESITTSEITKEGNYSGIRIKILAELGNISQNLQIDIGFGDVIIEQIPNMQYPTLLEMDAPDIQAYSIESIIAEKFEAMIDLAEANSRMKDFYDVYKLLNSEKYDENILRQAITTTFTNRYTIYTFNHSLFNEIFYQDTNRIKQWKAFLKKIKLNENLDFSTVMKIIKEKLKPIYENLES